MKIVLPGGSGQVGSLLARALQRDGHEIVVFSRHPEQAERRTWRVVPWDAETVAEAWLSHLDGADVVINLAGRSVNCRYTPANRAAILDSRVRSTRAVGEAIAQAARPPRVWLQASTATIYSHRYDLANDEATGVIGAGLHDSHSAWQFSVEVALAWEATLAEARTPRTRKVALRSAMTMSPDAGGIFDTLLGLVRRGLGGTAGDGRQFISWVHEDDFVQAIRWLIEHDDIEDAINIAAPHALPNAEFMRALRDAAGVRIGLPATAWMLEIGAIFLRTETELILKSRRVVPQRLLDNGFTFRFPHWPEAARDLYQRWTRAQQ